MSIKTLFIGNPVVFGGAPILDFANLTDSIHFKETVEHADAIVAIDTRSNTFRNDGRFKVAYGLGTVSEKKLSNVDEQVNIAFFALDFHYAHEVTQFIHSVYAATGHRCDDFTIREDEEPEHPQD